MDQFMDRCWVLTQCPIGQLPAALSTECDPDVISQTMDVCYGLRLSLLGRRLLELGGRSRP
jgi:hypothetical protein